MENDTTGALHAPLVQLVFSGERDPAAILEIDLSGARILMLKRRPLWIGRFLALSIADMPAIPADIRVIDGEQISIAFRTKLHQSVLDLALTAASPNLVNSRT